MSKPKAKNPIVAEEVKAPVFTIRFLLSLALMAIGIAWIVYYYAVVRVDTTIIPAPQPGGPKFMQSWGQWNYLVGFGLTMLGMGLAAHDSTPLGRGRGVVVGMLGSFLLGLAWIVVFYVFANQLQKLPVFNDLGQYNLAVGVGLMAVGFSYASRWE